jgi:polyvinyl alcohol dehydrogenase (cytochrome)
VNRAPDKWFLQMMSPESMRRALDSGVMREQAAGLSPDQRSQLVVYLLGDMPQQAAAAAPTCTGPRARFDFNRPPLRAGWGGDAANTRFVPTAVAGLNRRDVSKLKLRWAFAFPHATRARSQPALAGGAVMLGSQDGTVYALDEETGCVRWTYQAGAEVRTGLTLSSWPKGSRSARPLAYFADLVARVYAVDMVTGREVWVRKVDEHPHATVTAQPVLYAGRLYVSLSSREVMSAADPKYPCCSFRGSVVALDAASGAPLWRNFPIAEEPRQIGLNAVGAPALAPSGAAVWNSPTIDAKRGLIYFGTGQNYSSPAQGSSDAIVAVEIVSGKTRWIRQTTAGDAWNAACIKFVPDKTNCPAEQGPDFDYGSPPILLHGLTPASDVLVAGQKSGDVWGIAPDSGAILWHRKVGRGGNQGGEHFGMAAAGSSVFIPITDNDEQRAAAEARPGLHAVNGFTGAPLWSTLADDVCRGRKYCDRGISAAITAIPGVVFAGHLDGRLRAYDAARGEVLWEFDTARDFPSVSGDPAHGGALAGASGPVVEHGRVFVNSGYGHSYHMPGNALLVFDLSGAGHDTSAGQ